MPKALGIHFIQAAPLKHDTYLTTGLKRVANVSSSLSSRQPEPSPCRFLGHFRERELLKDTHSVLRNELQQWNSNPRSPESLKLRTIFNFLLM